MKHTFILYLAAILITTNAHSQKLVCLVQNGVSTFYTGNSPVNDAVAAALSGDTIYIPGGGFTIGTLDIDKTLTFLGVGHNPDSSFATGTTQLNGAIRLLSGASNSFLQGFYLTGNITLGSNPANQVVDNITISRINMDVLSLSYDGSSVTLSNNILVSENWLRGELLAGYATGLIVTKNYISQGFRYASTSLFTNNILFGGYCGSGPFSQVDNCLFQNNYFSLYYSSCGGNYMVSGNSNHFQNNVFNGAHTFPIGSNTGSSNWMNVGTPSFFVNCPSASFDYSFDYHLQSPGIYLGSDGYEVGIYGTINPFKDGSIPINPHIISKNIAPQTDVNGDLNIQIQVGAQDE